MPKPTPFRSRRASSHSSRWRWRFRSLLWALALGYAAASGSVGWWGATAAPHHPLTAVLQTFVLELALMAGFVRSVQILVRRRLVAPLQYQAQYDELTGLLRAGPFWAQAETQIQAAYHHRRPLAFVFVDLDNFKEINDRHGHLTGDAVLRALGQALRYSARQDDIVGRLGGEEFGWILPGATIGDARHAAERVLTACRASQIESVQGFAFSAGVAMITGTESDPLGAWDLARQADQALYRAKSEGKGRIVVVNP